MGWYGMGYSEGTGTGVRIVFAHMFVAFSVSLWVSGNKGKINECRAWKCSINFYR